MSKTASFELRLQPFVAPTNKQNESIEWRRGIRRLTDSATMTKQILSDDRNFGTAPADSGFEAVVGSFVRSYQRRNCARQNIKKMG